MNIDAEFEQYLETALWATNDESDANGGVPLDTHYGIEDFDPETRDKMYAEFEAFIKGCDDKALEFWQNELGEGQIGHDFWLTRCGHGAGFWDRFSTGEGSTYGDYLTKESKPYGDCHIYVGSDDLIYI